MWKYCTIAAIALIVGPMLRNARRRRHYATVYDEKMPD
jgi:hypothetical protein